MYSMLSRLCFGLLLFVLTACGKRQTLWTFEQLQAENYQEVRYFYDQKNNQLASTPDRFPMYPGGLPAFLRDLERGIKYNTSNKPKSLTGEVVARYKINREGRIAKVTIIKSLTPELDRVVVKCLRTIKNRWFPAVVNGNAVEITFIQTFDFSLE